METVAIVGVGLIGGSFALALRKAGVKGKIIGVSSPRTVEAALACKDAQGRLRVAVDQAKQRCGLGAVGRRLIGNLSKGYQQRVGIAQAILSDPDILILDEPTIGLDPKQIIEIRQLIRDLGGEKTVILSSHILPEVSQVCNRVIIVNHGELVAVDTPENLRSRLTKSAVIRLTLRETPDTARAGEIVRTIAGVLSLREEPVAGGTRALTIESPPDRDIREEIARRLVREGIALLEIYREELSLEDIFLQLVTEEAN